MCSKVKAFVFVILTMVTTCTLGWSQEVIDRIIAVVNEDIITVSDIRISDAFGIFEENLEGEREFRDDRILERLIDIKLVIQLMGENEVVDDEEIAILLNNLRVAIGLRTFEERLARFGLVENDLQPYLVEKLAFEKIIARRFSQRVRVSLQEIESYYRNIYLPLQTEKGEAPKPMTEILNEIEALIKLSKTRLQVEEWLANLRENAEIQVIRSEKNMPCS